MEDDAVAKSMTPSNETISQSQIGKIQDLLGDKLRKSGLPFIPVQMVIETQGPALVHELVAALQKRVDAVSDMIVRHVKVDRLRTPQQVLDATDRKQYTDRRAVETMPRGEGDEKDVYFFKLGRYVTDDELNNEYELRGLVRDPYAQAAVNEADPAFADEHPNGCNWKEGDHWNFAAFYRWCDGRGVDVDRSGSGWDVSWWFAGVRK